MLRNLDNLLQIRPANLRLTDIEREIKGNMSCIIKARSAGE